MEYIISKGIDTSRTTSHGYGETKPVATNDTDEGKQDINSFLIFEKECFHSFGIAKTLLILLYPIFLKLTAHL